jgi:hypothetical protein
MQHQSTKLRYQVRFKNFWSWMLDGLAVCTVLSKQILLGLALDFSVQSWLNAQRTVVVSEAEEHAR